MGVAQLEKLPEFIENKRRNYASYKSRVDSIPGLHFADTPDYSISNCWYYCLQINRARYPKSRDELMNYLADKGVQTRPLWYLNHLQKPYTNSVSYKIEKAPDILKNTLNVPCSVTLKEEEIDYVVRLLRE
jgi:dTDP-4-amino-4,6-dideoxygalactose transaminase